MTNMETNNGQRIIATGVAALMMAAIPAASFAQSRRQTDKNNMRNLGIGLGAAGAYELLKGNGLAGVLLGAGAAYSAKKYEDERKAQSKHDRYEEYRHHVDRYRRNDLSYSDNGSSMASHFPPIDVLVNNQKVAFQGDRGAQVIGGTTYVPLRGVLEKLGAQVNYDPDTKTVTAVKGDKTIKLPPNDMAVVDGKRIALDTPGFIENGQAMIPLRFMAEHFGADVSFDSADRAVHINSTGAA